MSVSISNSAASSGWFQFRTIPYHGSQATVAIVKKESQDAMRQAIADKAKESIQAADTVKTAMRLTQEQKKELSSQYDKNQMWNEQFDAFVDDLKDMDLLSEQEAMVLTGKRNPAEEDDTLTAIDLEDLLPHVSVRSFDYLPPVGLPSVGDCLFTSGGRALDWVKFQATYQVWDSEKGAFVPSQKSRIFAKLANIMNQL